MGSWGGGDRIAHFHLEALVSVFGCCELPPLGRWFGPTSRVEGGPLPLPSASGGIVDIDRFLQKKERR